MSKKILISSGFAITLIITAAFLISRTGTHDCDHGHHHDHSQHQHHLSFTGDCCPSESAMEHCNHNVAIYECDDCRYEAGIVKLSSCLINEGTDKGLIRILEVRPQSIQTFIDVTGNIELNQDLTVKLASPVEGILHNLSVDYGKRVNRGEVLFTVHSADLGRVVSDYRKSVSLAHLSLRNYERERELFENRISSELEMTEKRMEYDHHLAELQASEQALNSFGLFASDMEMILQGGSGSGKAGLLPVRAPFSGTVIERNGAAGELTGPERQIVVLSDLRSLWVWADVYEQDLAVMLEAFSKGKIPVIVRSNSFPGRVFNGTIDYIGSTVNRQTRTVKVRAIVDNRDLLLRPGMFSRLTVSTSIPGETGMVIPSAALLSDEGRDFVFVHWKEDYFMYRAVSRGRELDGAFEILSGLESGDRIVTDGAFLLKSDILREKMGAGCAD